LDLKTYFIPRYILVVDNEFGDKGLRGTEFLEDPNKTKEGTNPVPSLHGIATTYALLASLLTPDSSYSSGISRGYGIGNCKIAK